MRHLTIHRRAHPHTLKLEGFAPARNCAKVTKKDVLQPILSGARKFCHLGLISLIHQSGRDIITKRKNAKNILYIITTQKKLQLSPNQAFPPKKKQVIYKLLIWSLYFKGHLFFLSKKTPPKSAPRYNSPPGHPGHSNERCPPRLGSNLRFRFRWVNSWSLFLHPWTFSPIGSMYQVVQSPYAYLWGDLLIPKTLEVGHVNSPSQKSSR